MTRLLTPEQAAEFIGVSKGHVLRFIRHGLLQARALPNKSADAFEISGDEAELFKDVLVGMHKDFRAQPTFINAGLPTVRLAGVYFITDGAHVKIGWATSIAKRLRDLQVSNSKPLQLILWDTQGLQSRERHYHIRFASYRERGEWFRIEGDLQTFITDQTSFYWGFDELERDK